MRYKRALGRSFLLLFVFRLLNHAYISVGYIKMIAVSLVSLDGYFLTLKYGRNGGQVDQLACVCVCVFSVNERNTRACALREEIIIGRIEILVADNTTLMVRGQLTEPGGRAGENRTRDNCVSG